MPDAADTGAGAPKNGCHAEAVAGANESTMRAAGAVEGREREASSPIFHSVVPRLREP